MSMQAASAPVGALPSATEISAQRAGCATMLFDERPDPVDDVGASIGLVHDAGEHLPHLCHIGWAFV
jgi:hypothetical protein